jgi:glycosyltransferase involved in cell wall biosynthesis
VKKLLAFSHAGVLEVNRAIFQAMAEVADVEVLLIVPTSWQGDLIHDLKFEICTSDMKIRVCPLPVIFSGNGSLFFYRHPLRSIVEEFQPDFVFIDEEPWSFAAAQAFLATRGFPGAFFTKQNLKKKLPAPFRALEKWIFSQSSYAFSVAEEVTEVLHWKGYKKRVEYLPHSYDPELFKPLEPKDRLALRQTIGLPLDSCVVGYFGRLTEEKGVHDLLKAMSLALKAPELSHLHFLWVGNGPLFSEVKKEIERAPNGRATLIPAIPHHEVGKTLAATDILVLPSRTTKAWKEQFGRILVEALACGAALIGSDSGEIPNLIRRTGGGLVFKERDSGDLLAKLKILGAQKEVLSSYSKAGSGYVRQNLTHSAVARQLSSIIGFNVQQK